MSDNLAAPVLAVFHQEGVALSRLSVHGDRGIDAQALQGVQYSEDANAVAILPVGEARVVWERSHAQSPGLVSAVAALRLLPFSMFQGDYHAEGNLGVIWPAKFASGGYGGPSVVRMVHPFSSFRCHLASLLRPNWLKVILHIDSKVSPSANSSLNR